MSTVQPNSLFKISAACAVPATQLCMIGDQALLVAAAITW